MIIERHSLIHENEIEVKDEELKLEAVSKKFIQTVNVMQLKK